MRVNKSSALDKIEPVKKPRQPVSLIISEPKVAEEVNFPELHITGVGWGETVAELQRTLPAHACGNQNAPPTLQCTEVAICSPKLSSKAIYEVQEFILHVLEVVDVGHPFIMIIVTLFP